MKAIGLDIGTTTITAVVFDGDSGRVTAGRTVPVSFTQPAFERERVQNPRDILGRAMRLTQTLLVHCAPVEAIGITGQMHGILYLDGENEAISPLYTWQDERGLLPCKYGLDYAGFLSRETGFPLATGFGAVSHYYNAVNGLVPANARYICTIADYVALKLARAEAPVFHASNAASIGLYDMARSQFDSSALRAACLDASMLPEITPKAAVLGNTPEGVPVTVAIGDNQASFAGSVNDLKNSVLVNISTGSQISVHTESITESKDMEIRPYIDGSYLLVGSPLCGGRAYAMLETFFRQVLEMTGLSPQGNQLYGAMERSAAAIFDEADPLVVSTRFCGTRQDPAKRGSITNMGTNNATPQHIVLGFLDGIAHELHDIFKHYAGASGNPPNILIGSGNGMRRNALMQRVVSRAFDMQLNIPCYKEEAACGAALCALVQKGFFQSMEQAQRTIQYIDKNSV